jgi:hypothetical protein
MDLAGAATMFCTTPLESFDPSTGLWSNEGLLGNIVPTDRFISIYNRPVHLRQLTFKIGAALPASGVLRNPATGEVYIMGQARRDTRRSTTYVGTVMLHLVSGYAGELTELHRKAPVGPSNDPGVLVDSVITTTYFDIELRSALENDKQVSSSRGEYLLWAPATVTLAPWDFIQINSDWYRVHQAYFDSGFQMARVFKETDDREDIVYSRKSSAYNAGTGASGGFTDYNVTGLIDSRKIQSNDALDISPSEVDIRIMVDHIGFTPSVYDEFTASGVVYSVTEVAKNGSRDEWMIKGAS